MPERDEKLASLLRQLEGLARQIVALQGESAEAGNLARGVPRGRLLPPVENPHGPAAEMFSQVVPRNIGGGDGGVGAGGGGGGGGSEYDADETYIAEDEAVEPHVFSHKAIGDQPAPDRGADFVRNAPGHHITHTPGANMVNPAGHIDPSKTGASVGHAAPDTDENEVDVGAADVTTIAAAGDTATVDGTDGMSLTELTRIALDAAESGGPYLYAYFRKWLEDYKGHFTVVGAESRLAVYKPPWGTADKQMLAWDHDPGEWDKILPDDVWIDVDLATGTLKHIGPGAECYNMTLCGYLYTDAVGHVRCWTNGILSCGPCT